MYYIYIDETYNLREGSQNQFLAIAGFGTENTRKIAKLYKILKNRILSKKKQGIEIKSTDRLAEKQLRPQLFKRLQQNDLEIYAVYQYKNQLPFRYFRKNKLLYEQFYLNLLVHLFIKKWQFSNQKQIMITLDNFKTKNISKEKMIFYLAQRLEEKYPQKRFSIQFADSAKLLALQIADQICGIFYQAFTNKSKANFGELGSTIISNPLK